MLQEYMHDADSPTPEEAEDADRVDLSTTEPGPPPASPREAAGGRGSSSVTQSHDFLIDMPIVFDLPVLGPAFCGGPHLGHTQSQGKIPTPCRALLPHRPQVAQQQSRCIPDNWGVHRQVGGPCLSPHQYCFTHRGVESLEVLRHHCGNITDSMDVCGHQSVRRDAHEGDSNMGFQFNQNPIPAQLLVLHLACPLRPLHQGPSRCPSKRAPCRRCFPPRASTSFCVSALLALVRRHPTPMTWLSLPWKQVVGIKSQKNTSLD